MCLGMHENLHEASIRIYLDYQTVTSMGLSVYEHKYFFGCQELYNCD